MKRLVDAVALVMLAMVWLGGMECQCADRSRIEPVKVISTAQTVYPVMSFVSGMVVLKVIVAKSGKIEDIQVAAGIPSLTEAAERSLQEWKFEPARIDGKPVVGAIVTAFSFARRGAMSATGEPGKTGPSEKEQLLPMNPADVISTTPAWYPDTGIATGSVILQIEVNKSGAVQNIKVIHGITSFTRIGTGTVRQWKFKPAMYNGKPINGSVIASFVFAFSSTPLR